MCARLDLSVLPDDRIPTQWGLLVALTLAICFAGGCTPREPSSTTQAERAQPTPISVTAVKLAADYEANTVAGDREYKDRLLLVSGTVEKIDVAALGTPYLALREKPPGEPYSLGNVACYFEQKNSALLGSLRKGQKVTVRGKCGGKLMGVIHLQDCVLVGGG